MMVLEEVVAEVVTVPVLAHPVMAALVGGLHEVGPLRRHGAEAGVLGVVVGAVAVMPVAARQRGSSTPERQGGNGRTTGQPSCESAGHLCFTPHTGVYEV
jgi:hypothetical protein